MRPKELILRNIGPFSGEHCIHFDELGSLFLIYGQTGAGKTTLFDALSYAFYGKPLGSRSTIVRNLRSHFADEYAVADVTLTFYIGAQLYRIKRQLPYLREGRKQETPEEVLFEQYEDGTWKNRSSTNKRETDAAIKELIKLSDKEFSRIVLLPQGEFAQFLRAQSSEKKETLMHLFPVSRYTELMQAAKERAEHHQQEVRAVEATLESLHTQFDYSRYESERAELLNEIALIHDQHNEALQALQAKNIELEQEKIFCEKRTEYNRIMEELAACQIRERDILALKSKMEKARKAAPLAVQVNQLSELEAACAADSEQLQEKTQRLQECTQQFEALQQKQPTIEAKEKQRDSLHSVIDALQKAALLEQEIQRGQTEETELKKAAAGLEDALRQIETRIAALTEKSAALAPALESLNEREHSYRSLQTQLDLEKQLLDHIRKQEQLETFLHSYTQVIEKSRTKLAGLTRDFDIHTENVTRIEEEKKAAELRHEAAALAVQLAENRPCPVCGSLHHPSPAQETGSAFDFDERIAAVKRTLQQLQKAKEAEQTALAGAEASVTSYQTQLNEHTAAADSLRIRYKTCSAAPFPHGKKNGELKIAETARLIEEAAQAFNSSRKAFNEKKPLEETLRALQQEQHDRSKDLNAMQQRCTAVSVAVQEKQRQLEHAFSQLPESQRTGSAEAALECCTAQLQELKLTVNAYQTDITEAVQNLERVRGEHSALERHSAERLQHYHEKSALLETAYKQAGFTDLADLQQAVGSEEDINQWNAETEAFYEQYAAYKQAAASLETELMHTAVKSIETLEAEAQSLRQRYDEIQARLELLNAEKTKLEGLYEQHTGLTKKLAAKTAEAQNWVALAKDLTGSNPRKLQFDTWILSSFLHEVTVFANRRLSRMSEERYRLAVSEEQGSGNTYKGLDLEIADAYTGKCRPSATLSGGETFMASISLALGLADSIQARVGGIRIDSMFIDEGFGSLDEKALENAISILDEIRGNRMVGIISHVGELQSRIPQKIEVIKTGTGSCIRQNGG